MGENAPIWGIPDDLQRNDDMVVGQSSETWHQPRDVWRPIHDRVTGRGTTCAVLDTGVVDHSILPEPVHTRSFISGESVTDRNGHGTHCAGTVLGRDEDIGVAPEANLVVGKVLSNRGSGSSSGIAAGIRWATQLGVDVISMSLGGGSPYQPTINAIREAMNQGIIVSIAAGNSGFSGRGNTIGWPARSNEGVCVGATRQDGRTSGFSSGGSQMTVAWPGQQILSCSIRGGFTFMSGTSMAAPGIAGLCCLIIELMRREGKPQLKGREAVHQFFQRFSDDRGNPGHDPAFGHGLPNTTKILNHLAGDDVQWL